VPELFASAKRSVVVAGFAIRQGDRVFAPLASNMDKNPALDVRIFTNIQRAWKDSRADSEIVREFAEDFRRTQWSGRRYPRVLYDLRALSLSPGPRACLHAKCLIVDDERALVTSANFTEAAMDRNIEAGLLVEDSAFAGRLRAQFDALERSERDQAARATGGAGAIRTHRQRRDGRPERFWQYGGNGLADVRTINKTREIGGESGIRILRATISNLLMALDF
jgi:phosphatidylserine/phosphatidylglycerophosphate/cardiolipin synthase-like enzyme